MMSIKGPRLFAFVSVLLLAICVSSAGAQAQLEDPTNLTIEEDPYLSIGEKAAPPTIIHGRLQSFAMKTANQVYNLTSAGVVPDMTLTFAQDHPGSVVIQFCGRWYSNSNLSIVRLKARIDGVNAEPSTVHVIPVANFSGTGKHQLRCFNWAMEDVSAGVHTASIYNNPTGNALIYERSLTVLNGSGIDVFKDGFESGSGGEWSGAVP